jgi:putative addiction module killer protein
MGNLGDHKSVGGGIWEARLAFGPGYRIYFGKDGDLIIVLLLGGAKASQGRDIRRAQEFWRDYLEAKRYGKTK